MSKKGCSNDQDQKNQSKKPRITYRFDQLLALKDSPLSQGGLPGNANHAVLAEIELNCALAKLKTLKLRAKL